MSDVFQSEIVIHRVPQFLFAPLAASLRRAQYGHPCRRLGTRTSFDQLPSSRSSRLCFAHVCCDYSPMTRLANFYATRT